MCVCVFTFMCICGNASIMRGLYVGACINVCVCMLVCKSIFAGVRT